MQKPLEYIAGELILLSKDEHADYHIARAGIVLEDFNAAELLPLWADEYGARLREGSSPALPTKQYITRIVNTKFEDWLVEKGYVKAVKTRELHVGVDDITTLSNPYPDFFEGVSAAPLCLNGDYK